MTLIPELRPWIPRSLVYNLPQPEISKHPVNPSEHVMTMKSIIVEMIGEQIHTRFTKDIDAIDVLLSMPVVSQK